MGRASIAMTPCFPRPMTALPRTITASAMSPCRADLRILYIADNVDTSLASIKNALSAQQIDMEVQTPGGIPANVAALASYDAVVLSDVPADELGPAQMNALEDADQRVRGRPGHGRRAEQLRGGAVQRHAD